MSLPEVGGPAVSYAMDGVRKDRALAVRREVVRDQDFEGELHYFFTTFPVGTETFLQREQRVLGACWGGKLVRWSLWRGKGEWEGEPVQRISPAEMLALLWRLPSEIVRFPQVWQELMQELWKRPLPNGGEFLRETFWGILCGAVLAHRFRGRQGIWLHAAWGGLPATCCYLIARLNGVPWSFEAHAYDIFQGGGDWLLEAKIRHASAVRTSTFQAATALTRKGAGSENREPGAPVVVIRRGLDRYPDFVDKSVPHQPLRLLGIGRLIPKKGWYQTLLLCAELARQRIAFDMRIVGDGPQRGALAREIVRLGLHERVRLVGHLTFEQTLAAHCWADFFLFTGMVAEDGDRDGLPNVIPEAMACGTPVLCSAVGGIEEAIEDGKTGVLIEPSDPVACVAAVRALCEPGSRRRIAREARRWVEQEFDARRNATRLMQWFEEQISTQG